MHLPSPGSLSSIIVCRVLFKMMPAKQMQFYTLLSSKNKSKGGVLGKQGAHVIAAFCYRTPASAHKTFYANVFYDSVSERFMAATKREMWRLTDLTMPRVFPLAAWSTSHSCQGVITAHRYETTVRKCHINLRLWTWYVGAKTPPLTVPWSIVTRARAVQVNCVGHIMLALSWDACSLNKHGGRQLWLQPKTINQHNYVKSVFEFSGSNRMSLVCLASSSSLMREET